MLEKILAKMLKKAYPNRDIRTQKIGEIVIIYLNDAVGCNVYTLEGSYSYNEVMKLNALTNLNANFGFCYDVGPVAFIGLQDSENEKKSGYFSYNVQSYGTPLNQNESYFEAYTEEEAKHISNYIVYGSEGLEKVAAVAPISKINYSYDSRFLAKVSEKPRIFDMDCKLKGEYSYNDAKLIAGGTLEKKEEYYAGEFQIIFASVGEGQNVGIINMWPEEKELARGFRDVWAYGEEEPEIQPISFLTDEEAAKIDNFSLYVYNYAISGIGTDKYKIERYDRTLDRKFKFRLPDGTDYRLIEHNELFE